MISSEHPEIAFGKTGVLLVNLGTPNSTKWWDVRKYLKEFLSDRRVIEVNPIIWKIILNLFILTLRPSKSAHAYKKIWFKKTNESPLLYYTRSQSDKLSKKVENEKIIIDFAMRYGNPSIRSKLNSLKNKGCESIIILPLYPQYAAATTATVCDEVYRSLMKMRWQPSLQIIPHYESDPLYIDALVKSIKNKIATINWKPDLIITSYHGIPKSYFDKGDPYQCYCQKTTRLIKEKFSDIEIQTTFQSRFGPKEWLKPYTDKALE
ncbi:ferrochelatase, partial [Pelagibacteraceae bacterium]|nr:ferrochelatase [Pelagibacteraceae bacterium]